MPTSTYDENCITTFNYNASGTLASTSKTCDSPLKTQTGYFISFIEIGILVCAGFWFLMYEYQRYKTK